jgi:hypothetical protein
MLPGFGVYPDPLSFPKRGSQSGLTWLDAMMMQQNAAGRLRVSLSPIFLCLQEWGTEGV